MANQNKTTATTIDVFNFIENYVDNDQKKADSLKLIELMQIWSGFEPKMWGPTIVGFGSYHYKYASGHEGDAPLIAFSPRKAAFSLYVIANAENYVDLLTNLGKFKIAKACIYIKKLSDIDITVLHQLCKITIEEMNSKH